MDREITKIIERLEQLKARSQELGQEQQAFINNLRAIRNSGCGCSPSRFFDTKALLNKSSMALSSSSSKERIRKFFCSWSRKSERETPRGTKRWLV